MIPSSSTGLLHPFQILDQAGIREQMRVADFGCGALGHFVFPAAERVGPKGMVYAVDILRDALELVQRRARQAGLEQVTEVWSDIDVYGGVRIPASTLDLVLLVNNLILSQDRSSLVKEMARVTKQGGTALVVDWKAKATPVGPPVERRISEARAMEAMHIPEWELVEQFEAGPEHYGLRFLRTAATSTSG